MLTPPADEFGLTVCACRAIIARLMHDATRTQAASTYYSGETRTLMKLAGPLIVNNLSIAGMQFADAVMAGQLGAEALAAVAVGSSVCFSCCCSG